MSINESGQRSSDPRGKVKTVNESPDGWSEGRMKFPTRRVPSKTQGGGQLSKKVKGSEGTPVTPRRGPGRLRPPNRFGWVRTLISSPLSQGL